MGGQPAAHDRAGSRSLLLNALGREHKITLPDGARIRLQQTGAGRPLVLIPGWACSIEAFERNVPAFAERYHVIAYDPRSQGRSDQTAAGNNFAQRGDDLQHLIETLGLHRVALLGWSLGVFDALSYLARHGLGRVSALVLVDESPKILRSDVRDWGEGDADELAELIAAVDGPGYLPFFRNYLADGFDGEAPTALLDKMTAIAAALPPKRAAALLQDAARQDFTVVARRAATEMPVMQILRRDWANEATRWIRSNQPTAHIKVFGGHLMLQEYPRTFNRAVLSFLDRN